MARVPRQKERPASLAELAEDKRRYLEAKAATSPISLPAPSRQDPHECQGRTITKAATSG